MALKIPRNIIVAFGLGCVLGVAGAVHADAIQEWRTPSGTLYFGDHPPAGSILLETYADSPPPTVTVASVDDAGLAQAAAEGREIIRRREAERADARKEEAERVLRESTDESGEPDFLFVSVSRPCFFGLPCFLGGRDHHRDRHHGHHGFFNEDRFHQPQARLPSLPPRIAARSSAERPHPRTPFAAEIPP